MRAEPEHADPPDDPPRVDYTRLAGFLVARGRRPDPRPNKAEAEAWLADEGGACATYAENDGKDIRSVAIGRWNAYLARGDRPYRHAAGIAASRAMQAQLALDAAPERAGPRIVGAPTIRRVSS